ncbi:LLM class flavin-dependent oxidoreductase [Gordonia sp. MP11Mi]|uniref:Luciferase-like domain-containing protein n=1 Tax=Gordonia sp. MP11Mi TaxID=3022769 RepID=A0AA97CUL9_9ACTN
MTVFVEISIGSAPHQVPFEQAHTVAAAAVATGVTGLHLLEGTARNSTVDPSVTAAHLAGTHPALALLVDASTHHNAPYNLARRVGSLDRASAGRTGLVLRPGSGDEVSDAVTPSDSAVDDDAGRWSEYSQILAGLWDSFPASALIGNQTAGVVVDDDQLARIDHEGDFYRVRGPLDGPVSRQGRPPLVCADIDELGAEAVVPYADVVIVDAHRVADILAAVRRTLTLVGRPQGAIAVLARVDTDSSATDLLEWAERIGVDGFVVADSGTTDATLGAVHTLAAGLADGGGDTLREALGLVQPSYGLETATVLA